MSKNTSNRSDYINLRTTAAEKQQLEYEATQNGMTTSDYARLKLFGASSTSSPMYAALEERLSNVEAALAKARDVLDEE